MIISTVDFIILQIPEISGGTGGALSAFRGIRLLRVFKLARSWTSFRELLSTMIKTMKEIVPFSSLLGICMFIFTLLGMELFGHKVKFDENDQVPLQIDIDSGVVEAIAPRPNFDQFYMAFTAIFIVFIGEDWQSVMHTHYRVSGHIALLFFPLLYIMLNLILLNLFLAVLLGSFESTDADKDKPMEVGEEKTQTRLIKKFRNSCKRCFCMVKR